MKEADLKLSDEISSSNCCSLQNQMSDSLQYRETPVIIIIIIIVTLIEHGGLMG